MAELVFTETADGRVFASVPNEDGPRALTFEATGEAAKLLRDAGYAVRVVVERLDGNALTPGGRSFITAAMEAEARGESAYEAAAAQHFRSARDRLAAKEAAEQDAAVRKAG